VEISVAKALAEVRFLDRRIRHIIKNSHFVGMIRGKHFFPACDDEESPESLGLYRQLLINLLRNRIAELYIPFIQGLIRRRDAIKSAVFQFNLNTEVTIAGEKMTLADAVELRTSVEYEKLLIAEIKRQYAEIRKQVRHKNDAVCETGDSLLKSRLGKSRSQIIGTDDIRKILESYSEQNEWELVCPENIDALITELEDKADQLEFELDYVMSEANAAPIFIDD
jgi:hypothetical protein